MDLGLTGRVALVTGAGRGIGREIAVTLAVEGARVAVNDLFEERARAVVSEIEAQGGEAMAAVGDVTSEEQVGAMVEGVMARWRRLDILVNNAGIPVVENPQEILAQVTGRSFADTEPAEWPRIMDVITYGVLHCSRAVLPHMVEARWGRIVNIVSDAGRVGEPRLAPYSMAKAGVIGFTKALAKEVGRHCITVNCVSPGTTVTESMSALLDMAGEAGAQRVEAMKRAYPMARGLDRLGLPSDIASAVAFLASAKAEWITGQTLSVSGGYSMVS